MKREHWLGSGHALIAEMPENEEEKKDGGAAGTTDSIVLEEEIDPNYSPSEQEVVEYAKWLGMDLEKDSDLFWIGKRLHVTSLYAAVKDSVPFGLSSTVIEAQLGQLKKPSKRVKRFG